MQAVTRRLPVHISVTLGKLPHSHLKYNGEGAWPGLVGCRRSAQAYLGPCLSQGQCEMDEDEMADCHFAGLQ
jgi:hypothetical protein